MEARFMFFFHSMMAMGRLRPWAPTTAEVGSDLRAIWDAEKLTDQDLRDPDRLVELLENRLAKYAVKDPRAWIPEMPPRKRRSHRGK